MLFRVVELKPSNGKDNDRCNRDRREALLDGGVGSGEWFGGSNEELFSNRPDCKGEIVGFGGRSDPSAMRGNGLEIDVRSRCRRGRDNEAKLVERGRRNENRWSGVSGV